MYFSPSVPNYAKDYQEIPEEETIFRHHRKKRNAYTNFLLSYIDKKGHVLKSGSWPVSPSKNGFFGVIL
jgi:hypothetical protein